MPWYVQMCSLEKMSYSIPHYQEHAGTIKVSGSTEPRKAGRCAMHMLRSRTLPVDFLCIGANANQQASKTLGVFMLLTEQELPGTSLAFKPLRFMVSVKDAVTGEEKDKDAMVWRTVFLDQPV